MFTSRIRDAVLDLVYPHLSAGSIWGTEVVDSLAGFQLEDKWVEGQKVKWQQKGQQCHKFSSQFSAHFKHVYRIPAGLLGIKYLFRSMACKSMHNFYVRCFFSGCFWLENGRMDQLSSQVSKLPWNSRWDQKAIFLTVRSYPHLV